MPGSIHYQDVMAPKGQPTELVVRGPNGQGFSIRTLSGDEAEALARLRDELREAVRGGELQAAEARLAALTREPAPSRVAVVAEPVAVAVEPKSPGRPADRKRQADKLREIAAKLVEDATAKIEADRQENTHRRASMAASIRKRAYSDQVIARALTFAADEVERGQLTYIARLTSRPQVDDLEAALRRAHFERLRKTFNRATKRASPSSPTSSTPAIGLWSSPSRGSAI